MSPAELEWISDLYRRIASVTTRYVFTEPVTQDDMDQFADALAVVLPSGCTPTVASNPPYVRVSVHRGAHRWYYRDMIVERAPGSGRELGTRVQAGA